MDTSLPTGRESWAVVERALQNRTASIVPKWSFDTNHLRNGEPKMNVTTYG